jgi:hypothetical protein
MRSTDLQRPGGDHLAQLAAFDQFHDHERLPFGVADVVDGDDTGMLQTRGSSRFGENALVIRLAGDGARQHFQRYLAAQPIIARAIDLAHTSGADGSDDFVRSEPSADAQRHCTGHSNSRGS